MQSKQVDFAAAPVAPPPERYDLITLAQQCPQGLNPRLFGGILLKILQTHFSKADYIFSDAMRSCIWSDTKLDTKIRITADTALRQLDIAQTPAVVMRRGRHVSGRQCINDAVNLIDPSQGTSDFVRTLSGETTLTCIGPNPGSAEELGLEVFNLFTWMSPVIRKAFNLLDFQVTELDEVSITDELGQPASVAVRLAHVYEYGWTVTTYAPRFDKLAIDVAEST